VSGWRPIPVIWVLPGGWHWVHQAIPEAMVERKQVNVIARIW
jgi:hypothetical protein